MTSWDSRVSRKELEKEKVQRIADFRDPTTKINRLPHTKLAHFIAAEEEDGYFGIFEHLQKSKYNLEEERRVTYVCFRGEFERGSFHTMLSLSQYVRDML